MDIFRSSIKNSLLIIDFNGIFVLTCANSNLLRPITIFESLVLALIVRSRMFNSKLILFSSTLIFLFIFKVSFLILSLNLFVLIPKKLK